MRIIDSSCHRGTSTILGTIIFIGILFTAVIPMMLVMRQADTLHDTMKHEVEVLDQEKAMETLCLYVCPESLDSSNVKVTIVNKGEVLAHVVKLWINDDDEQVPINVVIPSMSQEPKTFELDRVEGAEYDIRVMTDRGNVFLSENGLLRYEEGSWQMETFSIRIFTSGFTWFLRIIVKIGDSGGTTIYDELEWVGGGGYEVVVPEPGNYYVKITKWGATLFDEVVNIPWPIGDPYIWIFV